MIFAYWVTWLSEVYKITSDWLVRVLAWCRHYGIDIIAELTGLDKDDEESFANIELLFFKMYEVSVLFWVLSKAWFKIFWFLKFYTLAVDMGLWKNIPLEHAPKMPMSLMWVLSTVGGAFMSLTTKCMCVYKCTHAPWIVLGWASWLLFLSKHHGSVMWDEFWRNTLLKFGKRWKWLFVWVSQLSPSFLPVSQNTRK